MKKNLKKVISAVIALALSASTFATMSFADYSDVPSTASYAEGVSVLSALGIISGNPDGTFKPENTIKRSEAAKIVVGMVNAMASAEKKAGATKFNDVAANHWASGYINYGADKKWINGKTTTTFDPDGLVTGEQMIKMVVANLGYSEDYVKDLGGYPKGYTDIAELEEIVDAGDIDYKAPITRGEVAELVYKAMKTPLMKSKGSEYSPVLGKWVPKLEKQDADESTYYKTLLTEEFEAYLVEGSVTGSAKTGVAGLEADEVNFKVQKTEKYDSEIVVKDATLTKVKVGDTDAAAYINTYAVALITMDEDGANKTILTFTPSAKNNTVELDATLYDEDYDVTTLYSAETTLVANPTLRYFASEDAAKSSKYELDPKFQLYVNGVKVTANKTNVDKYIVKNPVGSVELVDVYAAGSVADGLYDFVYVDYFATAMVNGVSGDRIVFKSHADFVSAIELDTEKNEDLVYGIYLNGEEISISELKKNDVLSIAWDVNGAADESDFYDIYVARDTAEGKLTSILSDEKTIVLGGQEYSFVYKTGETFTSRTNAMSRGSEYVLNLDVFGRIYGVTKTASNVKYAIIYKYFDDGMSDYKKASLFLADGTTESYEVDLSKVDVTPDNKKDETADETKALIEALVAKSLTDRVVKYTLKDGVIVDMAPLAANGGTSTEFKAATGRVSGIRIDEASVIVDAVAYKKSGKTNDLALGSYDAFVDGSDYTVYAYGEAVSGVYPFAILTDGKSEYTEDAMFAVVTKTPYETANEEGDEGYGVAALINGEEVELFVENGTTINSDKFNATNKLAIGDVFFYLTDASGAVEEIKTVYSIANADFAKAVPAIFAEIQKPTGYLTYVTLPVAGEDWVKGWNPVAADAISLVFGPIVPTEVEGSFTLAQVLSDKTNLTEEVAADDNGKNNEGYVIDVAYNDDTRVVVYDYTESKTTNRVKLGTTGDIMSSEVQAYIDDNGEILTWTEAIKVVDGEVASKINFAFAKVVDGVATDVYVILGE